jgi:hypothetical protein
MGMKSNEVTRAVIGGAIEVHRTMGPGLLESAYEAWASLRAPEATAGRVPRVRLDCGYRIDLLVEDVVLVELKAVSRVLAIHQAQMMTYRSIGTCVSSRSDLSAALCGPLRCN